MVTTGDVPNDTTLDLMKVLFHVALGVNLASIATLLYVYVDRSRDTRRKRMVYVDRLQYAKRIECKGRFKHPDSIPDEVLGLIISYLDFPWLFVCRRTRSLALATMLHPQREYFENYSQAMQFKFKTSLAKKVYLTRYVITSIDTRPLPLYVCASCGKVVHELASCTECVKTVG